MVREKKKENKNKKKHPKKRGVAHPDCGRRRGSASSRPLCRCCVWGQALVVAVGRTGRSWTADGGAASGGERKMLFGEVTSSACEGRRACGIRGPKLLAEGGWVGPGQRINTMGGGERGVDRGGFSHAWQRVVKCVREGAVLGLLVLGGSGAMAPSQGQKRGGQRGGRR